MKQESFRYQLIVIAVLGSLVRLAYGLIFTPWNQAPDHIALEILVEDGGWSYDQLIHYPHEGGTILMSLLGRLVNLFTSFNSLTIVALLVDFFSRLIQLFVVRRIAPEKIFYAFGLWTIFATPTIIPYGTLNYGLHSLASFFPFVLMYLLWLNKDSRSHNILLGLFLGFSIWFSYSNAVLLVPFIIIQLARHRHFKTWVYAIGSLALVIGVHLMVRIFADPGFHLKNFNLNSIRGETVQWTEAETWSRLYKVWLNPLAESGVAVVNSSYTAFWFKYIWISLVLMGLAGCIKRYISNRDTNSMVLNLAGVFLFVSSYAISPFYCDQPDFVHFVCYRHLTYIIPLLAFFTIFGLSAWRVKKIAITAFLVISVYSSGILFLNRPGDQVTVKAAGWVLTLKLGDDPERLNKIISNSSYDSKELYQGAGWGMALILFQDVSRDTHETFVNRTEEFIIWFRHFPENVRFDLVEGLKFAFDPWVTPQLNQDLLDPILTRLGEEKW